jgi:hypothetical protein
LFTDDGPGGAVVDVGGESQGLIEAIRETPVVEETEVGDGRQELVPIEVPMIAPRLDVGGANRARGWMPEVPENAENQGWSRRKLPPSRELQAA